MGRGHGFISILPSIVPNIISHILVVSHMFTLQVLIYGKNSKILLFININRIIFYTSFKTLDQNLRLNILHKSLLHETKLLL